VGSNPRKPIWHLRVTRQLLDTVEQRPREERLAFRTTVEALLRNPSDRALGVRPIAAVGRPRVFSVPIQDNEELYGVLTFELYRDHPVVHLFWVTFFGS
jgi:hypothetical protein